VREFEMKDAYTFDADEAGLDRSYQTVVEVYRRIFARCGMEVVMVEADSGVIGGKDSNEFIVVAESGEDTVLDCVGCGYAANGEKADSKKRRLPAEAPLPVEEVHTPGVRTIQQLADFLGIPRERTIKVVFYRAGGAMVVVSIRGDLEVNETKLRNALGGQDVRLATPEEVRQAGIVAGSASAAGLEGVRSVADDSVTMGANFVAGANREDYHLRNVNYPRDFRADVVADIALAREGDACPSCGGKLRERRGIEAAHVFKLGTGYSEKMHAVFRDEAGRERPFFMGCYGIGVGRLLAAAVEAHHDERGMTLPRSVAPYEVYLANLNPSDAEVTRSADALYEGLQAAGVEVLYDDRDEAPGVKFNDADLIGPPVRAVVSRRSVAAGQVELKRRTSRESSMHPVSDAVGAVRAMLEGAG
jgi:prolyl-tRNA synthetase